MEATLHATGDARHPRLPIKQRAAPIEPLDAVEMEGRTRLEVEKIALAAHRPEDADDDLDIRLTLGAAETHRPLWRRPDHDFAFA